MISHFFVSFFLLVSAPHSIPISLLPPLSSTPLHTHIHTPHTPTVYIGLTLLITICKTSTLPPFIFPPFPQLSHYFSLPAPLPLPFQPALPPPMTLFSLSLALSQPCLMCGCKSRCFDLTLGLFSTSVHSCWRPFGVLWGPGRGLLFVECGSPANMLIQNTNLQLTSEGLAEKRTGGRKGFNTTSSFLNSSLPPSGPLSLTLSLSFSFSYPHFFSLYASVHT